MHIGLSIWPKDEGRWLELGLKNKYQNCEIIRLEENLHQVPSMDGLIVDGDHPGPGFIRNYRTHLETHGASPLLILGRSDAPALSLIEWDPDSTAFISKPAPIDESIAALDSLFRKFSTDIPSEPTSPDKQIGYLAQLHLADLLQMLCQSSWTGKLEVLHLSSEEAGYVFIQDGHLWDARQNNFRGLEACYRMLTWPRCRYVFADDETSSSGRSIAIPWQEVVLEGARRIDDPE
ncbi:MAG: DUF4388 domain-containing protein [Verrucomicrobiota bacterium]